MNPAEDFCAAARVIVEREFTQWLPANRWTDAERFGRVSRFVSGAPVITDGAHLGERLRWYELRLYSEPGHSFEGHLVGWVGVRIGPDASRRARDCAVGAGLLPERIIGNSVRNASISRPAVWAIHRPEIDLRVSN